MKYNEFEHKLLSDEANVAILYHCQMH